MAEKAYLSLNGLKSYDVLIKALMDTKDDTVLSTAKSYADDAVTNAADNYDSVGTAKTLVDSLANGQVATNTAAIAVLNGDSLTEGSVAKAVADLKQEISDSAYDDSALTARVSANEDAIETLNGDSTVEGSVAAQVAAAVAQIVADAPEAYDTLKEIADWISNHADSASAMNTQINQNTSDIADLVALIGTLPEGASSTTVVAYIAEAIGASETTLTSAIATAKSEAISTAASDATTKADAALASAKSYTDEKITEIDTGVQTVTTGTTNGTISVDGTEVAVAGLGSAAYVSSESFDAAGAADTALASANSYTDDAIANLDTYTEITTAEIDALFAE